MMINGKENYIRKLYNYEKEELESEYEYLYGEKNGKAVEYYKGGKIRFEGEYLNNEKWNGKGYDIKGEVIFEIKDGIGLKQEYDFEGKLKDE